MNTKLRILPIIIFFTFLQLITIQIYAQQGYPQKVIVGTVTDENGRPLSGVLIKVQGAASGIRTDADGNYTLPYSNSSQALWHGLLIISYPGYRTKLIRTLEHRNIDIKLTALSYEEKAIPLPSPVLKTNAGGIYTESSWDLDLLKYNFTRPPDNPDPPGDTFDPILNGKVAINSPVIGEYTIEAREDRSINTFGKDFSINGKHNQDTKVWIYRQTSFDDARLYDATMIGERPDYLVATIEAGEPYGMYLMWIENENGPGYPVRINAPLLTWIGPDHATPGSPVNLYGQNLSHNNGTQTSYVYLRRWGSGQGTASFPIQVTEINPYKVMAILPDSLKTNADYEVWLHNGHGGTYGWSGPMKLHIDESYPYKWNGKTISVKDYGAAGDGLTDDSKAIQAAIDAATDGNKIFFPGGKYRLVRTGLSCTKSLSFEGEGAGISVVLTDSAFTQTQMLYIKDFPAQIRDMKFVTSKPDGKGLRILVRVENPDKEKTVKGFIVDHCAFKTLAFGGNSMDVGYGINCLEVEYVNDISITHNEFITQVAITSFSCDEIYIKDNTLYGNWKVTHGNGNLLTSFPGHIRRMDLSNNFFQSVDHTGPVTDSAKVIVRAIVFQNWHGGRHDRIYIAGNTVDRAGNPWDNSGEIILMELPTEKKVYKATSVGMVTMTLNDTWQDNSLSRETIAIIKNTGLGQFRRIIANSGNQITIDRPWDIQPDMTSVVSINSSMDNTVIYNNTITGIPDYYDQESATSGIQFYGAAFNNVIAGNTFQDIHYGIYITGFAADPTSDAGNSTGSIGTLVTGNKVLNAVYGLEAITVMYPEVMPAKLPDEIPWSSNINTVMRDNHVSNIRQFSVNNIDYGGYGIVVGQIYNEWQDPVWNGPWVREILIEHNTITNAASKYIWLRQHQQYTTVRKNIFVDNGNSEDKTGVFYSPLSLNSFVLDNTISDKITIPYGGTLPGPRMQLNKRVLEFHVTDKQLFYNQAIIIKNAGSGSLNLSISDNAEWLHAFLDKAITVNKDESIVLNVRVDPIGIPPGKKKGSIVLHNTTDNTSQTVGVDLIVDQ